MPERLRIALAAPAFVPGGRRVQRLDFEILLSYLRRTGHDVVAFDSQAQGLAPDALAERLASARPDLLHWHLDTRDDCAVAAALTGGGARAPAEARVMVAGGYFGARNDLAILEAVPRLAAVVRGEAETTLAAVAGQLAAGQPWEAEPGLTVRRGGTLSRNPPRPLLADLDALPMAASDFFSTLRCERGQQVLFSRGCLSDCSYCALKAPYREQTASGPAGHWRSRSAAAIVDEIEFYHRRLGVELFRFSSFVFFGYDERGGAVVRAVAEEIVRRRFRIRFSFVTHPAPLLRNRDVLPALIAAGLVWVTVGVDTGLDRARALYRLESSREEACEALALLHRLGIPFTPSFIFYDPYLTLLEVRENLALIAGLAPWFGHMPQPFAYFLDRHLLRSGLRLSVDVPLYSRLVRDGLAQPVDPLREDPAARFRDPRVGRLRLLHGRVNARLGSAVRRLYCSARVVARFPFLATLPLAVVERLADLIERDGESSDEEVVEELLEWTGSQLRPCLDEALDLVAAPPAQRAACERFR